MNGRQIVNQNSYVLVAALVLIVAGYFVGQTQSLITWLIWIGAAALLIAGYFLLRPGGGSKLTEAEVEKLVGSGTPVMLELYSNY